jgi:hypothetical protein
MRFLSILLFLLVFIACSSNRYINPSEYPNERINFGDGGGFSGMVTEYSLLDNGQLLKKLNHADSFEMISTIDENQTTQLFNNYKFLDIGSLNHNQPGNTYCFIQYHKNLDTEHKVIWDNHQTLEQNPNVKIFYKNLKSLIPTTSSK